MKQLESAIWHQLETDEVLRKLESDFRVGVSAEEAIHRTQAKA